tara:strand:+ start:1869 stop:2069 length:201 start_codon:yes stop_codon:yes gene_type:complete
MNKYQQSHPIYMWRKEQGLTQTQVSKLFGYKVPNAIGSIERGERMTNKRHLDRLEELKGEHKNEAK